ncbi:uncharacterized protein PODANS_6_2630 [Podospora anserina S mat+]|uniref:Podospora anserina S mat+ genomic DNA chromosome 6, supercontig 2 n=3 Tax=Podospora TaxID=5144 RepID=B2B2N2_PODAN|nr:uncharacterized protein PODANS_6_2630 [Podospora anserina S mat+]KAK4651560.1 hypothetical protein QC762_602630 [Podospora pseudocomata]CAP71367.1 unnamed protein product [Podospora anserina S mat+]CDP30766.1 Putative protein of unknown function [Podospora anserina S mat+]VBB83975.1 Putative protein of unknown function [Podospora comata]
MASAIPEPTNKSINGDGAVSPSPGGRHPSISLQATATLNAQLQRESPSRRSSGSPLSPSRASPINGRRLSQVITNLQLADPSVPAPGEMLSDSQTNRPGSFRAMSPHRLSVTGSPRLIATGEPRHNRAPSLGEIHQELETEQEFQVNRLLGEIRRLQEQVDSYRRQQSGSAAGSEDPAERTTTPIPTSIPQVPAGASSGSLPRSPVFAHPRSSFDVARADLRRRSRTPSRGASPRLRSTSISGDSGEQWHLGCRDESAFYQAETQMLIRENQMLKHRIKELERQLTDSTGSNASITHEPSHPSHLTHSTSVSEEESSKPV